SSAYPVGCSIDLKGTGASTEQTRHNVITYDGTGLPREIPNLFVAKLDRDGAHQWSQVLGRTITIPLSLAVDSSGTVAVAGKLFSFYYNSNDPDVPLDLGQAGQIFYQGGGIGSNDTFVIEFDGQWGDPVWGKGFSPGTDYSGDVQVVGDGSGTIF